MTADKPLVTGLSPRQCLCLKLRPGEIMLQWQDKSSSPLAAGHHSTDVPWA